MRSADTPPNGFACQASPPARSVWMGVPPPVSQPPATPRAVGHHGDALAAGGASFRRVRPCRVEGRPRCADEGLRIGSRQRCSDRGDVAGRVDVDRPPARRARDVRGHARLDRLAGHIGHGLQDRRRAHRAAGGVRRHGRCGGGHVQIDRGVVKAGAVPGPQPHLRPRPPCSARWRRPSRTSGSRRCP